MSFLRRAVTMARAGRRFPRRSSPLSSWRCLPPAVLVDGGVKSVFEGVSASSFARSVGGGLWGAGHVFSMGAVSPMRALAASSLSVMIALDSAVKKSGRAFEARYDPAACNSFV